MWIDLAGAILGMGLIFFIINQAIKHTKNFIRAWINLGMGLLLVFIFLLSWLIDRSQNTTTHLYAYLFYICASGLYGLIGMLVFLFDKIRYAKTKTTSKVYFQEYLFLLLRTKENILLIPDKKKQAKVLLFKLKKTDFHDDVIKSFYQKWGFSPTVLNHGKIILSDDKKIYHGYLLFVEEGHDLSNWESYSNKEPKLWPANELEKEMMLRLNLLEPFVIEK